MGSRVRRMAVGVVPLVSVLVAPMLVSAAPTAQVNRGQSKERFIVVARSDADFDQLRGDVQQAGGSIVNDIPEGGVVVVSGPPTLKSRILALPRAGAVANDHIETLVRPTTGA